MRVPVTFALVVLALVLLAPSASAQQPMYMADDAFETPTPWTNRPVEVTVFANNPLTTHIICQAGPVVVENNDTFLFFTLTQDGIYRNPHCAGLSARNQLVESASVPDIEIDQTPPTVTFTPTPLPNANGWFNAPVTLHYQVNDAGSGPYTPTPGQPFNNPSGDFQFDRDGAGQTVTLRVLDIAGNIATASYTVSLDTVKPAYTLTRSPAPFLSSANINNTDVAMTITPSDTTSGIDTFTVNGVPFTNYDQTFTAEGTTPLNISITDVAGNVTTATEYVKIDKTPPTVRVGYDHAMQNGWFNAAALPVTVTFFASDPSKVQCDTAGGCFATSQSFVLSSEGRGIDIRSTPFVDSAGNQAVGEAFVNIDKTPPTVTVTQTPSPNRYGWNNTDVTVHMSVTDSLSGSVETSFDQTFGEGANQGVFHRFFDQAGNATDVNVYPINVDKTPPTVSVTRAMPSPNVNGWNNTDVLVQVFAYDNLSGTVNDSNGAAVAALFQQEGANLALNDVIYDRAGNSTPVHYGPIRIDKTPPTWSVLQRLPAPNAYGWNNMDVSVTFNASDAVSGIAGSGTVTQVVTTEGQNQSANARFTDLAGNDAFAWLGGISIDKTPPDVTCFATPARLWPPDHKLVDITTQTSFDDSNGVANSGGPANGINLQSVTSSMPKDGDIVGWTIGTPATFGRLLAWRASQLPVYTFIYSASDLAGNAGNCSAQVSVGR